MATKEELQKLLEKQRAKAQIAVLSKDDEEIDKLRSDIAKQDAIIRENEKRARTFKEDDIFERLQTKYAERGDVHRIDTDIGMWCMVLPSIAKARHFQGVALKGKLSPDSIEDFVKPCIVWCPGSDEAELKIDGEVMEGHIEKYTLLVPMLCQFAQNLASAHAEVRGKK